MNGNLSSDKSNIYFLIGFMGSGKSLLSQGVSELLDLISIEMDDEIVTKTGMSINEIFEKSGEDKFRKIEREVLHDLINKYRSSEKTVLISTGGGAPCHYDNMQVMNHSGTTIFIKVSVERLSTRLEFKKQDRPLVKDRTSSEIREYVKNTLGNRLPYYNQARIIVNTVYDEKNQNIEFLKDIILADRNGKIPISNDNDDSPDESWFVSPIV